MAVRGDFEGFAGLVFSRSADEARRIARAGGRMEVAAGMARIYPEMSAGDFNNLQFGEMPASAEHAGKLLGFVQPGTAEWRDFFASRKVVEREMPDGRKVASVASNLFEAMQENPSGKSKPGQRRYQLAAFLADPSLHDKFDVSVKLLNSFRTQALADPDATARRIQEHLRTMPQGELATVTAGNYSRSKKWARGSVSKAAARVPQLMITADMVCVGDRVHVFGPGGQAPGVWSVEGPQWLLQEVMAVRKMVLAAGTSPVMFALGSELTILNIDIHNGTDYESPSVTCHAGSHDSLPNTSSARTMSFLTPEGYGALAACGKALASVELDGLPVATAIRVTAAYALVNSHVLREGEVLTVDGAPAEPYRMISRGLWLVKTASTVESSWALREPQIGEPVVVCYRRFDKVVYSQPLTVRAFDGEAITTSSARELSPGMSGAAIIALKDFALLGSYEGVGPSQAVGLVFSQAHFTEVCTIDQDSSTGHEGATASDSGVFARFKDRGLGKVASSVFSSLIPLYTATGVHIGVAYKDGGDLYTTCEVHDTVVRVGVERRACQFERVAGTGYYVSRAYDHSVKGPMLRRKPTLMEKVFVVGTDSDGPYVTDKTIRVEHVSTGGRYFVLDDIESSTTLPLVGGLVVAFSDCSVLGAYAARVVTQGLGTGGRCLPLPERGGFVPDLREGFDVRLAQQFPMLRTGLWPAATLREVVTHASHESVRSGATPMSGLACVGDAALKLVAMLDLHERAVPTAKWQEMYQAKQSNAVMGRLCVERGLHEYVLHGRGVTLPEGGKVYADLYEAIAGAVYKNEPFETFRDFAIAAGLMPFDS